MKILVYGAGNMGQLYAARLKTAGYEVKLLARGRRLRALQDGGIRLEEFKTGRRATVHVDIIEQPLPAERHEDMVWLKARSPLPIEDRRNVRGDSIRNESFRSEWKDQFVFVEDRKAEFSGS